MTRDQVREMMRDVLRERVGGRDRGWGGDRRGGREHGGMGGRRGDGRPHGMGGPGKEIGMRILFAVVDAEGDGGLSIEELNGFQERIFTSIDQEKDGRVTMEEIRDFFDPRGPMDNSNAGDDDDSGSQDSGSE